MRIAIICYSFTQNNRVLASEISARTGGTLFTIEERKARTKFTILFDLIFNRVPKIKDIPGLSNHFDHYILVAPVWGGKIASPLRALVLKIRSSLTSYSFITVCGGAPDQKQKIVHELTTLVHKEPLMVTELSLSSYLGHPKGILDFKISNEQLKFFAGKINEFVEEIGVAPAIK